MPKRKGQLTIPAMMINGERTQLITINVQPNVPVSASNIQPLFLESEVDKDSVYVQQQIIYTLRIFQSMQLENMNITEPEFDLARVEKLGQNTFQRRIQNTPYRVYELRYAIFPQQSGRLTIPELVFTANETVSRRSAFSLPGQGRPLRKMSRQHQITVKNPPSKFNGDTWLPAKSLKLQENWSADPDQLRVGGSITRSISIQAEGLLGTQLPPLTIFVNGDAKTYPDQGSNETELSEQGANGKRIDSAAIIPTREGDLQLPEIKLQWWDTDSNRIQQAVIPARTLKVQAALSNQSGNSTPLAIDHSGSPSASGPATEDSSTPAYWQWLALLFAAGWIITALIWWRKTDNKNTPLSTAISNEPELSEKKTFKALSQHCRDNDAIEMRHALINWAQYFWPNQPIHSLQDIRKYCGDSTVNNALLQLDSFLYASDSDSVTRNNYNGESLLTLVKALRSNRQSSAGEKKPLKPLYQQ
jgi:hypothetical protein